MKRRDLKRQHTEKHVFRKLFWSRDSRQNFAAILQNRHNKFIRCLFHTIA